jgi:hypothetical protein
MDKMCPLRLIGLISSFDGARLEFNLLPARITCFEVSCIFYADSMGIYIENISTCFEKLLPWKLKFFVKELALINY